MKLVLWGAGGHAGVVLDAVRQEAVHEPVALLSEDKHRPDRFHRSGLPIHYGRHNLGRLRADGIEGVVIAIGDEVIRSTLAAVAVEAGFELCKILHPSAVVSPDVRVGRGTVIFAGAVVQTGSDVGQNVIVNTCASVDHDCHINDGAQLAPRVVLGGRVKIGDLTFVGIGATVMDGIDIGRNCLIGAGAVVVRNIPDHSIAYGLPARVIRQKDSVR